jgi:hypothetical protein
MGAGYLNFFFFLIIDVWTVNPSQYDSHYDSDIWSVDDTSANWANSPVVHDDTLEVEIQFFPPSTNYKYKCTIDVYIENEETDVNDTDSSSWFIFMTE